MTSGLKRRLYRCVDERREDTIRLCSEMLKIPSENPPGNIEEMASFTKQWLEDQGLAVATYEPKKGRVNLIVEVEETESPTLIINGHMDVVPAGDPKRWEFPPFCGEVREGNILGRGATDMKGGLTSIMIALTTVLDAASNLPGKLILNIVPDEETGGEYGSKWCLETGKVQGDACLIGEPTGTNSCFIGEKGICWLRLTSKGTPAHGSLPMLGENAIEKLAKTFPLILKLEETEIETPNELSEVIRLSQEFHRDMVMKGGITDEAKLKAVEEAINHCTVNIGTIRGGVKNNIVPESCAADIDIRVPAGTTPEETKVYLEESLRSTDLTDIECEIMLSSDPNYTAPTERIHTALSKNIREVLGIDACPLFITGGTDGRFFRLKSIPTISYGPGEISQAHSYNEYVPIEDLVKATKVIAGTIADFMMS